MTEEMDRRTFAAVVRQADRCVKLLEIMRGANEEILKRVDAGEAIWMRVAQDGYNTVCQQAEAHRRNRGSQDAYLDSISQEPAIRAICADRYYLGQEGEKLSDRLKQFKLRGESATPYEEFEQFVRDAITQPDRSPRELAREIEEALKLAKEAQRWKPAPKDDATLVDNWLKRAKNQWPIAALIVAGLVLSALFKFYDDLPAELKSRISEMVTPAQPKATGVK